MDDIVVYITAGIVIIIITLMEIQRHYFNWGRYIAFITVVFAIIVIYSLICH